MFFQAVRAMIGEFASRVGWFFFLVGLIPAGLQAYDALTSNEALATVTEVRSTCQKQLQRRPGVTKWLRIKCEEMAALEASGVPVRATPFAYLMFTGVDGIERKTWVRLSKLELKHAEAGQHLKIVYRGRKKPYVAPTFDWSLARLGFGFSLLGLVLLAVGRSMKSRRMPTSSGEQTTVRHTSKPTPVHRSAPATPVRVATAMATGRSGSVQRQRGILERIFS